MIKSNLFRRLALVAAASLLPAACAQPNSQPAPEGISGMSGKQGHTMQGMDMPSMMKDCIDMRQQMAQGTHQATPEMARIMAHCDEMDHSMDGRAGLGSPMSVAPAATRSR